MRRFFSLLLLFAILFLLGCSNEPRLIEVEGTVSYKGQPVPKGVIFFDPDVIKKHTGPQGFAYIQDGRFTTKDKGRGVLPGPHSARVQGMDGVPKQELPFGKPLFPETELPFEIKEGQSITINVK